MSAGYPVQLDVHSPPRFDRVQLGVRLGIAIVLGWFGITMGWVSSLLYVVLPVFSAGVIASVGVEAFRREQGPQLWRVLAWFLRAEAYMMLLVDRFPTSEEPGGEPAVAIAMHPTGTPTPGTALLRLATSLPSGIVLALLGIPSAIAWLVAAVIVLLGGPIPRTILAFQRAVLCWQARLFAYHASLVAEYPPWTLHPEHVIPEEVAC